MTNAYTYTQHKTETPTAELWYNILQNSFHNYHAMSLHLVQPLSNLEQHCKHLGYFKVFPETGFNRKVHPDTHLVIRRSPASI